MPLRTYLYNRLSAQKFRLNGVLPSVSLPSKENLRQFFSDHILFNDDQLPPKVDLRSDMTPVEDQSRIGSCTANSLAGTQINDIHFSVLVTCLIIGAYEYLMKKTTGSYVDVSRLFIYYNGRFKKDPNTPITDKGCSMTKAIEALEEYGTCFESVWPYNISSVNVKPSDESFEQAKNYQITEALKININLSEMKACLAQGFPFAFGLRLYKSFDKAATTGVVPMPNDTEQGRTEHGRHAMLAVGYSDQSKAFIVRNSWGEKWGDKGYCYIPYDYLTNPDLCFDAWTIRQVEKDDLGHDYWDHDDSIDYQMKALDVDDNDDDHEIQEIDEDDESDESDGSE
ncbi:unnamed protein product, partial [Rotaria sordida]